MADKEHRQVGQPQALALPSRHRLERMRADGGRNDALALQLRCVVDTPRRTGPSVSRAGEDDVALFRECLDDLGRGWRGGVGLASYGDAGGAVPLHQHVAELPRELGEVRLRVVEEADALKALAEAGNAFGWPDGDATTAATSSSSPISSSSSAGRMPTPSAECCRRFDTTSISPPRKSAR